MRRVGSGLSAIAIMSLIAADVALAQAPSTRHGLTTQQRAQIHALRPKFERCRKSADQQNVGLVDRSAFIKSCLEM